MSLPAIIVFGTGAAVWSVLILTFVYWFASRAILLLANMIDRADKRRAAKAESNQ